MLALRDYRQRMGRTSQAEHIREADAWLRLILYAAAQLFGKNSLAHT